MAKQHQLHFQFTSVADHRLCSLFCAEVLCHACKVQGASIEHGMACAGCVHLLNTIYRHRTEWGNRIAAHCQPSVWRAPELCKPFARNLAIGTEMANSKSLTMANLTSVFKDKTAEQLPSFGLLYSACTSFQARRM
jgi:hypothetical protein